MILEATSILSEWFRDPTHGVNEMAAELARNKIGGGKYDKPRPVTVFDDCNDESVAKDLDPAKVPALVIFCDSDISIEMQRNLDPSRTGQVSTGLVMVASYIVRDTPDLRARQEGNFVLRGAIKSLNRFNVKRTRGDRGELNGISITRVINLRMQRVAGAVGRSTLAGFIIGTLEVLDKNP